MSTLPDRERTLTVRWRHHRTPGTCRFWDWPKIFGLRIGSKCVFNVCRPCLVSNHRPGSRPGLTYNWATYCCSTRKTRIWRGRISNKRYVFLWPQLQHTFYIIIMYRFPVVIVSVHKCFWRCQVRSGQRRGRTLPTAKPIEFSQTHFEESRRTVAAQYLLAL